MKKEYNVLTLRVPRDLKDRLEKISALQGVSMNQLAVYALARELSAMETTAFFREQHRDVNPQDILSDFDAVMAKVPDRPPPAWDRIDEE